jgi:serine/threonine-protein kinase
VGEVFAGRYELLDLIGQGGMGSVWRVHDRRTDQVVAAKVLRQSDAASLLRFVRETAFRIQHPHVVTPLGWAGEDDRVLFTMPVVDGGSVATLVGDHGPLPAPFVAEILRQVLDGLGAVHASRVVHRDVKPANILLRATGADRPHAYLTDFGIAVELDGPRLTQTDVAIGTPGYMAPEQRRGEVTTASDLYALGAVAIAMLTAQPPPDVVGGGRPDGVPGALWDLVTDLRGDDPGTRPDAPTARGRLDVPELAWHPGAVGDVEVLHQVIGEGPRPDALSTTEVRPTHPDAGTTQRHSLSGRRGGRLAATLIALGTVGAVALLLTWSPWQQPSGMSASSSSSSSPGDDSSTGSTTSTGPTTTNPTTTVNPASPSTSGSYEIGVVVTAVGQECSFSDVGLEEETTGGVAVVCRRGDDGAYSWERITP